jgi:hypothetical protein
MFSVANNGALFAAGGITYPDGSKQVTAKRDCSGGRYEDNGDGTVSDCRSGLIWLKNANCKDTSGGIVNSSGILVWPSAKTWTAALGDGLCGLHDGSYAGDWRLPTKTELMAMVESAGKQGFSDPKLGNSSGTAKWSQGNPFDNVIADAYWSASPLAGAPGYTWYMHLSNGYMGYDWTTYSFHIWPVRAGQ